MSVSPLPEWKQLLLERKRREEEERERREKKEEEKLASMPAWKRGLIQRRRAKQEGSCDKDRETDVRSASDGLSDKDGSVNLTVVGSDQSLSPDPGKWLDTDIPPPQSQVSVETIVPVHENPFILTQSGWKWGREADKAAEIEQGAAEVGKDKETEKASPRDQNGESGRGRDLEVKIDRIWDRCKRRESTKDVANERATERDLDPPAPLLAPLVSSLRTIRANNIIIIEQDLKGSNDNSRGREVGREMIKEDHPDTVGATMDLRALLTGGGSVTEIRASEVLIIKPSADPGERIGGGGGRGWAREDGETDRGTKCPGDGRRDIAGTERRPDVARRSEERETLRGSERPWGQATVVKDRRKGSGQDGVLADNGGRVSQLLTKFGEHPKPSRSKSSENFRLVHKKGYQSEEEDASNEKDMQMRGVPKRSYSFSDCVLSTKENGVVGEGHCGRRVIVRAHPETEATPWVAVVGSEGSGRGGTTSHNRERAHLSDAELLGKPRDGHIKSSHQTETERRPASTQHRAQVPTTENSEDKRSVEATVEDKGFTMASVKSTGGICFAKRVQIRQDGRTKAVNREVKRRRCATERNAEEGREGRIHCPSVTGGERGWGIRRVDGMKDIIPDKSLSNADESYYKSEHSNLLCTVDDNPIGPQKGTEWNISYRTPSSLSQHTEELISTIERVGESTSYCSERGEGSHRAASDINQYSPKAHDTLTYGDVQSESLLHVAQILPKPPQRTAPMGIPPRPLELQIPRTVFYVAEEVVGRAKRSCQSNNESPEMEGKSGVERMDSWRIGKALNRVESLREKIRHRERERMLNVEGGDQSEGARRTRVPYDERELETERGREAASQMRKKLAEADGGQEGPMLQTATGTGDVTQDICMLKNSLQLPVSLHFSQAIIREEVTNGPNAAVCEVVSDAFQTLEDDDDPPVRVAVTPGAWQKEYTGRGEPRQAEEALSREEIYSFPLYPTEPLTLSPPFPSSLAAMSRIYNLKTVGSRTGLCVREKTTDIPSVRLNKVKPLFNAQQEVSHQESPQFRQHWAGVKCDNAASSSEDTSGVHAIQCHVEQLQLIEQEVASAAHDGRTSPREHETQETQSSRRGVVHHGQDDGLRRQQRTQQTSATAQSVLTEYSPPSQPKQNQSNQDRSVTITPKTARSHTQDEPAKPLNHASTPASSPASSPPLLSPTVSPSPTPSPTPAPKLFIIRSASGGQVKRGATITITPKKPAGREAVAAAAPTKPPGSQTPAPSAVAGAEPGTNRYPTVEEIEVIGGYQSLEKSCLVQERGTPKRGKVCFDEDQLEQVFEYPSEISMLACTPEPLNLGMDEWKREKEEEEQEEEEVEQRGPLESTRNMGTAMARVLKLDKSF